MDINIDSSLEKLSITPLEKELGEKIKLDKDTPLPTEEKPSIAPQNSSQPKKRQKKEKQIVQQILPELTILVMHGFQQYRERIEEKIHPWVKFLSKFYTIKNVLIPEAPNKTLPSDPNDPFRCWLALNKEDPTDFDGRWTLKEAHYHFFEESENHLLNVFKENQDINLMINFSQGSLFGSLFVAKHRDNPLLSKLKSVINICGVGLPRVINKDLMEMVNELYDEKNQLEVSSLFLIGDKDVVVPIERTEALSKWFKNKQFLKFEGPHCIPKQKVYLEQVKIYLDSIFS